MRVLAVVLLVVGAAALVACGEEPAASRQAPQRGPAAGLGDPGSPADRPGGATGLAVERVTRSGAPLGPPAKRRRMAGEGGSQPPRGRDPGAARSPTTARPRADPGILEAAAARPA